MAPDAPDRSTAHQPMSYDASTSQAQCAKCKAMLKGSYHLHNDSVICGKCRMEIEQKISGGQGGAALGRAVTFGVGAMVAGAALNFAVAQLLGVYLGILCAAAGFLVGQAVNYGSRGNGGRNFQLVAVGLAYLTMGLTFAPLVLEAGRSPLSLGAILAAAPTAPVAALKINPIAGLLVFFALARAWRANHGTIQPTLTGPFRLNVPQPPPAA
jgi:hypothetical protein